jgi:hypothetical protein
MFGKKYSDLSLCYENLILQKEKYIKIIFDFAKIDQEQYEKVKDTVSNKIQINKWKSYADEAWFKDLEKNSENLLTSFFR